MSGQQLWSLAKGALAIAIVIGVGWQFVTLLHDPEVRRRLAGADPAWLTLSAVLYLLGFGCFASFWIMLVRSLGEPCSLAGGYRAYYVSQLGKYVPGKAWALVLRTTLAQAAGTRTGVAGMTSLYEVLTTMTAGALLAVLLLAWEAMAVDAVLWKIGLLIVIIGVPILPPVFNRLTGLFTAMAMRGARPVEGAEPVLSLPRLSNRILGAGLLVTGIGWWMMGLSLWAMLQAVLPDSIALTWESWCRYTASISLAYVAGFVVLPVPSGLGVREWVLQRLLTRELHAAAGVEEAEKLAAGIAILLRLLWTIAEVLMAALMYWLPPGKKERPV